MSMLKGNLRFSSSVTRLDLKGGNDWTWPGVGIVEISDIRQRIWKRSVFQRKSSEQLKEFRCDRQELR